MYSNHLMKILGKKQCSLHDGLVGFIETQRQSNQQRLALRNLKHTSGV